jgi:membrane associated rhomboid family serine protease
MTAPEILIMALNLVVLALALCLILFARDLFLNASPGIDVFAHTVGFLAGFALSSAPLLAEHNQRRR